MDFTMETSTMGLKNGTNFSLSDAFSLNTLFNDTTNSSISSSPPLPPITTTATTTTVRKTTSTSSFNFEMEARWYISMVVIPCIGVVGLVGNSLSLVLLSRDGLKKSSNILLLGLTVFDFLFICSLLFEVFWSEYEGMLLKPVEGVYQLQFYSYVFFRIFLLNVSIMASYTIPMLITMERLCAIFFPLKFHIIITPKRCFIGLATVVCTYSSYAIFMCLNYELKGPLNFRGKTFMAIGLSKYFFKFKDIRAKLDIFVNEMCGSIPVVFLIFGSLVIGYKVKMAAIRRAQMMSQGNPEKETTAKSAAQTRTTRTLLAVCVTFVVLAGIVYLYDLISDRMDINKILLLLLERLKLVMMCINSSANFFIYIFSNNKFKTQFWALIRLNGSNKSDKSIARQSSVFQ